MTSITLQDLRQLVAKDQIKEVFKRMVVITSDISQKELQKNIIGLSAQFTNWNRRDLSIQGPAPEIRNRIVTSLIELIHETEIELNKLVEEAEHAEQQGDLHEAVVSVEKVLSIVPDKKLEEYRFGLSNTILSKSPPLPVKKEKFSFVFVFLTTFMLCSILPAFIYKQNIANQKERELQVMQDSLMFQSIPGWEIHYLGIPDNYSSFSQIKTNTEKAPPTNFSIANMLNLILQISLLVCMVLYRIKPRVDVDSFIKEAAEFYRKKFNNRMDYLKWFSERANESIMQFGHWWRLLGLSFLALYTLYYVYECIVGLGGEIPTNFEEITDVVINGSEAFFLFVIYRIITDDTIKPSPAKDIVFEQDLNYQGELFVLTTALFLYIIGIFIYNGRPDYGVFSLISRTISGALVAVGLCLIIGRLDSKFIEPKKWELWILYLYAAIQLLFTLFDPSLFKSAFNNTESIFRGDVEKTIDQYFGLVKMWVLYFILVLKGFFIYFVIKIHQKNYLFYYLLLGSKLNDEIKEGKKVKGYLH